MSWRELETGAPELGATGREIIERHRFVLVGTIRRDGTPRISPVEARVVEGRLVVVIIPGTRKAKDVRRDPRVVINSPVVHPDDPNEELKLRGRAVPLDGSDLRTEVAEAIQATSRWRPPLNWLFFELDVDDAAHMLWQGGVLRIAHWTRERGLRTVIRSTAVLNDDQAGSVPFA